jgi:uncharacterized integral membrane protein
MAIARRLFLLALLVGLLYLGWKFSSLNAEPPVRVDFLVGATPELALWQVLIGAFAAGALLATALWLFEVMRYALVARRYRRTVARLESEIHELRNLPLADGETPLAARSGGALGTAGPPGGR